MSYARFGCDDSDVYVYASCSGGIDCCGCAIYDGDIVKIKTSGFMIEHLNNHRAAGHTVPDYTYEEILDDYPDLTAVITGDED